MEILDKEQQEIKENMLVKEGQRLYPNLPIDFIQQLCHDYLLIPDHYDDIYNGKIKLEKAKKRDNQDTINEYLKTAYNEEN